MCSLVITGGQAFDGENWLGPVTVRCDGSKIETVATGCDGEGEHLGAALIVPGLIDHGVVASGYNERPDLDQPFRPESNFALMALRYGVTTLVDIGSALPQVCHLQKLNSAGHGPQVAYSGGRLSIRPTQRTDITVSSHNVEHIAKAQLASGATFISAGIMDDPTLVKLLRLADQYSTVVVLGRQSRWDPPGLVFCPGSVDPRMVLSAWEKSTGTCMAPQLGASSLWTVDGLLGCKGLEQGAPFLPYARHFAKSRGIIGRRVSRDVLNRLYGNRPASEVDPRRDNVAADLIRTGRCLASSGCGNPGLIPGLSLWTEIDQLWKAAGDLKGALRCATGAADVLFPGLGVGRLQPGRKANLLIFDRGVDENSTPMDLLGALSHVVVDGCLQDISELAATVKKIINAAMEETI